jgi:uncharacterized protein YecE (DUF72 family)
MLIGTSGWTYASWKGSFYPEHCPRRQRFLEYYAQEFLTTEVNSSFYHLPRVATYEQWAAQVPADFVFALKVSRLITHHKRLVEVEEPWRAFVGRARVLGRRLGPLLLQFPPSFQHDRPRLARFLAAADRQPGPDPPLRLVFEFRHESWFREDIYDLLRRHGAAVCVADSPRYPRREVRTAAFAYLRFHGRTQMFASSYTDAELAQEAQLLKRDVRAGLDVFVYFNNDACGHAVANARKLRWLMEGPKGKGTDRAGVE